MNSRGRQHTDQPSWEQQQDSSHSSNRHSSYHTSTSGQPSHRHLHRHASDVSNDRLGYLNSRHRAAMEANRTDYPTVAASRIPRGSSSNRRSDSSSNRRSDSSVLQHVDFSRGPDYHQQHQYHQQQQHHRFFSGGDSQGSQGSQGSGGVVYRQKPSSSSSLDRSSYSAGDSSSFNSRDPLPTTKVMDNGYYHGSLRNQDGTPNSSISDDIHVNKTIGPSHPTSNHYRMPRSQSTQATPLSSYSHGLPYPNDDHEDGGYTHSRHSRDRRDLTEAFSSPRQPLSPTYFNPQSPVSPISSSYSSESDRYHYPVTTQVNNSKAWYEDDDPDIVSGMYFPGSSRVNQQAHYYETIPHYGPNVPGRFHGNSNSQSPQPPQGAAGYTDHKRLAKERLDYYFMRQQNSPSSQEDVPTRENRRESSPAEYGRVLTQYRSLDVGSPIERKHSDTEIVSNQTYSKDNDMRKVKRVKSSGIGFGKLVKKIGQRKSRQKDEIISDFKSGRSHSMENIDVKSHNSDTNLTRKQAPESPSFTPKLSRQRHRQNSEPDLESALGLFRTNSKKNLYMDPVDALFDAIEMQDYDTCFTILTENDLDINAVNEDDWTPLDLAVMLNDQIACLLIQYGAKDSNKYYRDPSVRYHHVFDLLTKAEVEKKAIAEMNPNSKELQKQINKWRNKSRILDKMLESIQRSTPPSTPREVSLTVTSDRTLNVRFSEPESMNGAQVTRYKVEWSKNEHFAPESGEFVLCDGRRECIIPDLDRGERYYVRVYAFNMKGFGPPRLATPSYAIPSSWHDYSNTKPRFQGCTTKMSSISMGLNKYLNEQQQLDIASGTPGTPSNNNKRSLKKGLTRLFSQGAKFSRSQKSGVYLASLMHSDEGRILVTVDEYLPIIEISDSSPGSSIGSDFAWLTKLSCTWENIREMCESTEGHTSLPSIQFRYQLLQAVGAMQIGTGQTNLGLFHHKTFHDSHGTTIFLVVQYIEDHKTYTGGSNKWSNFVKLLKKYPQLDEVFGHELTESQKSETLSAVEQLIMDIPNIIHHHSNCHNMLSKGLYLGYLKARLSLASMTLVTSSTLPNVFPHYQIRPNPNISREEWAWIQSLTSSNPEVTLSRVGTGNQVLQKTLLSSIEHFLEILGIPPDEVDDHQLYIDEVIELNEDVTFLLITPPPDEVCTPPGGKDLFDGQHFSHLPITAFELLQLYTYQRAFVNNFTLVSCRLDIEIPICNKRMRESLSTTEGNSLKRIKENYDKYQEETENVWKHMRWIETAVQSARNSSSTTQLTILQLKDRIKVVKKAMSVSASASSISTMASSTTGGTLSPSRKSLPNVNPAIIPSRQLTVFPGYDAGLAKGTSVRVPVNTSTTALDVIKFAVNEFEQAGKRRRFTDRDLKEFYLAAMLGHHEDILPLDYTPLQMLNFNNKYKFIVRKFSMNQCTTEV